VALAAALVGWLRIKLLVSERIALLVAALLMLFPEQLTDIFGLLIFAALYVRQRIISARQYEAAEAVQETPLT
jgi:TRAP-type uncharacterized transport system fused permease subunit